MDHFQKPKEIKLLDVKSIKIFLCLFASIVFHPILVHSSLALETTIVEASPLESYQEALATEIQTNESYSSILQSTSFLHLQERGSPNLYLRGSESSEQVSFYLGRMSLNAEDGSGVVSLLIDDVWLESLAIYKQPSSVFYGSGAMIGAVSLKPKKSLNKEIHLQVSSLEGQKYSAYLPLGESFKLAYSLQDRHGSYNHDSGLGHLEGRVSENEKLREHLALFHHSKILSGEMQISLLSGKEKGVIPPALDSTKNDFDRRAMALQVSYEGSSWLWEVSHLLTDYEYLQSGFFSEIEINKTQASLERKWNFTNYQQILGFKATHLNSWNLYSSSPVDVDKSEEEVYSAAHISITSSVLLEPQIRYLNEYEKLLGGLVVSKNDWQLSYQEGFRSPTPVSLYVNSASSVANPNLEPEESNSWQVTYKANSSLRLQGFYHLYNSLFSSQIVGGKFQTLNLNKREVHGLDLSFAWEKVFWALSIDATYQESDERIALLPRYRYVLGLSHYYGPIKFGISLDAWQDFYVNTYASGFLPAKDHLQVNFSIETYKFKSWSLGIYAKNIRRQQITYAYGFAEPLDTYEMRCSYSF